MDRHARTLIVGGALVGPATALLLNRAGFKDVTVVEASKIANPTSGGVMGLREETVALLTSAGIDTGTLPVLVSNEVTAFDIRDGEIVRRGSSVFPGLTTNWETLHRALTAPLDILYSARVTYIHPIAGDIPAVVEFGDGSTEPFDLIVFADGRRSIGRTVLDPERVSTYQGYVTWRGLINPPTPRPVGFHRYFDGANGTLFSVTEPQTTSGLSYWEYSHNLSESRATEILGGPPTQKTFLLPHQTGAVRHVLTEAMERYNLPRQFREMIAESTENLLIPVNDLPFPSRAHWKVGSSHVAIIGDALIPARLQVGAGLNQGIKQSASLARYLGSGQPLATWETEILTELAPWIEVGRRRAHATNLGRYSPVRPGWTAVPNGNAWSTPVWTPA